MIYVWSPRRGNYRTVTAAAFVRLQRRRLSDGDYCLQTSGKDVYYWQAERMLSDVNS